MFWFPFGLKELYELRAIVCPVNSRRVRSPGVAVTGSCVNSDAWSRLYMGELGHPIGNLPLPLDPLCPEGGPCSAF